MTTCCRGVDAACTLCLMSVYACVCLCALLCVCQCLSVQEHLTKLLRTLQSQKQEPLLVFSFSK